MASVRDGNSLQLKYSDKQGKNELSADYGRELGVILSVMNELPFKGLRQRSDINILKTPL